jgi:adenylate cyclase
VTDHCRWLADAAEKHRRLPDLHHAFCDHLLAERLPIWRASLGLEVLHPETSGAQFRWIASEASIEVMPRGDTAAMEVYASSPVRIVDETRRPYRRRLDTPIRDMSLLEELRQAGATDYVIIPLAFLDRNRIAHMSFATRQAGGFSDLELAQLEEATRLFSPYAERYVLKRIAIDLLDIYLGHRSGERVFSGAIERGAVENIRAVICMADLRGFTRFSDEQPIETVLATLNSFFGVMVEAIASEGGEVLEFMGDALLAIFPETDHDLSGPSQSAMAAAAKASRGVAELGLAFGLALHTGEVAYGNIGGRTRLDFTVIGPAVNHTNRLLELSKKIDRPVVISGSFAECCELPLTRLGKYRLRDVARSHDVYLPNETVARTPKQAKNTRQTKTRA